MQREEINIQKIWWTFFVCPNAFSEQNFLELFFFFTRTPIYGELTYKILYSREHKILQYHCTGFSKGKLQIISRWNAIYPSIIPWGLNFLACGFDSLSKVTTPCVHPYYIPVPSQGKFQKTPHKSLAHLKTTHTPHPLPSALVTTRRKTSHVEREASLAHSCCTS